MVHKSKSLIRVSFLLLILISSCCIFKTDSPDLRQTGQSFPSTVNASQIFNMSFTIANISSGDCSASASNQCSCVLRMVNRATGFLQVNNSYTLNSLGDNESNTITASVNIGTPGTYDFSFTIDQNNTAGQSNRNNDVYTGTVIVN